MQIAHPSVSPSGTSAMMCSYRFYFLIYFYFFYTSTETSLNRSQTRRPDKSVAGCNHRRTVSVFMWGLHLLFSSVHLAFKVKGIQKSIAGSS